LSNWTQIQDAATKLANSLDMIEEEKQRWFLELLMNNTKSWISEKLSSRRENIGLLLEWKRPGRRKIPNNLISLFVVETLDLDLLSVREIRRVLLSALKITSPERFQSVKSLISPNEEDPLNDDEIYDYEITMGSKLAKSYCNLIGISTYFSTKGTSDGREFQELISTVKKLPELTDFQLRVRNESQLVLSKPNGRSMIVMPTGSGKTRTTIESVFHYTMYAEKSPTIIWIADRDELCEQAYQSFKQIFVNMSLDLTDEIRPDSIKMWRYWGGLDRRNNTLIETLTQGVYVTSVQTLQARIRNQNAEIERILSLASIAIVDEAHRNLDFLEELDIRFRNSENQTKLFGLSATPLRRDRNESSRLHHVFDNNILCPVEGAQYDIEIMINELTERKILSKRIDLDPHDLIDLQLITASNEEKQYLQKVVQIIQRVIEIGRKSILVFTKDVEHARIIASALKISEMNIVSEYIDASTPVDKRKGIIRSFRNAETDVLLNFGILTTGFDAPNTDAVIICRPLDQEDSLFKQMIGRGLRGSEFGGTEDCIIVHFEEEY
jgi:DNA repair protein RadD